MISLSEFGAGKANLNTAMEEVRKTLPDKLVTGNIRSREEEHVEAAFIKSQFAATRNYQSVMSCFAGLKRLALG
jgi:hypothetical protein